MNQKMNYKIILDSCGEIPEKLKGNTQLTNVALMIHIGEETITDDDTFDPLFCRRWLLIRHHLSLPAHRLTVI